MSNLDSYFQALGATATTKTAAPLSAALAAYCEGAGISKEAGLFDGLGGPVPTGPLGAPALGVSSYNATLGSTALGAPAPALPTATPAPTPTLLASPAPVTSAAPVAPAPAPTAAPAPTPAAPVAGPQHPPTAAGAVTQAHLDLFKKQTGTEYNPHSIRDRMSMMGFQRGMTGDQAQQYSSLANRRQVSPNAGQAGTNVAMLGALNKNPNAFHAPEIRPAPTHQPAMVVGR